MSFGLLMASNKNGTKGGLDYTYSVAWPFKCNMKRRNKLHRIRELKRVRTRRYKDLHSQLRFKHFKLCFKCILSWFLRSKYKRITNQVLFYVKPVVITSVRNDKKMAAFHYVRWVERQKPREKIHSIYLWFWERLTLAPLCMRSCEEEVTLCVQCVTWLSLGNGEVGGA